jgi:peptidoglycan/xylan/chitin deacetylase (PgdA/CDA1 family)
MHTWSHPHLPQLNNQQLDNQVQLMEDALYKILGVVPACIRAPYGEIRDDQVKYLNDRWGLVVVGWNVDSGDANGDGVQAALARYRQQKAPKHVIALNHETVQSAVDTTMPQAYDILRSNGYSAANIMTVASALKFNPYKVQGQRGSRDASWTCDGKPLPGAN